MAKPVSMSEIKMPTSQTVSTELKRFLEGALMPIQELLVPPKAERLHLGEEGRKSVPNKKNEETNFR